MTANEAIGWITNLTMDIGKLEHSDLWHYEQALDEIRELLERVSTKTGHIKQAVKPKLSEEARLKRNEYVRNWKRAHPEKRKEYQRRFWEKQAAKEGQNELDTMQ